MLLLAALIVVPLGAAAGSIIGGGTESPNGLVDAAGYRAELEAARAVVPIPPTATWPPIDVRPGNYYSRTGGRTETEYVAFCLWSDAWLVAHRQGDRSSEQSALERMQAYQVWIRSDVFADQSVVDGIDAVVGAAAAGQPGVVARYRDLNCSAS